MSNSEKIDQLLTKIRDNNNELLSQVRTLPPADQKVYSEKVSRLIEQTHKTVSGLNKKSAVTSCTIKT